MSTSKKVFLSALLLFITFLIFQFAFNEQTQIADPNFTPKNTTKKFNNSTAPVIAIDEAHNNFLTASGRYRPFAQVLESYGFKVKANNKKFTKELLNKTQVLVIANALDRKRTDWMPPYEQAMSEKEVAVLIKWIKQGGSLLLIADHTPFPKIIENLTDELGFQFSNGHVDNAVFRKSDNTLANHLITEPRHQPVESSYLPTLLSAPKTSDYFSREINKVRTFGGSAFLPPTNAVSLLTLTNGKESLEPEIPFQINTNTKKRGVGNWSQGAILELDRGRIAVFSEGMMFSSQYDTKTGNAYGLSSSGAEQNELFLLRVMSWLTRTLEITEKTN